MLLPVDKETGRNCTIWKRLYISFVCNSKLVSNNKAALVSFITDEFFADLLARVSDLRLRLVYIDTLIFIRVAYDSRGKAARPFQTIADRVGASV